MVTKLFTEIRSLLDKLENLASAVSALPTLTELDAMVDDRIRTVIAEDLDVSDAVGDELQDRDLPDRDEVNSTIEERVDEIITGWNSPVDEKVEYAIEQAKPDLSEEAITELTERLVSDEEFRAKFNRRLQGLTDDVAEEVAS
jgi:uncharacterized membrane-anchored protein YjiN (DUF445 family)